MTPPKCFIPVSAEMFASICPKAFPTNIPQSSSRTPDHVRR
ncbi:Hypothetical Protein XCAW_01707 [Xanthomonas citri subsp. citri Aw12879]|nr:Hypothetical Protein XCAW_01707 [Xanthomonas citri subsp. citri Aw12879]